MELRGLIIRFLIVLVILNVVLYVILQEASLPNSDAPSNIQFQKLSEDMLKYNSPMIALGNIEIEESTPQGTVISLIFLVSNPTKEPIIFQRGDFTIYSVDRNIRDSLSDPGVLQDMVDQMNNPSKPIEKRGVARRIGRAKLPTSNIPPEQVSTIITLSTIDIGQDFVQAWRSSEKSNYYLTVWGNSIIENDTVPLVSCWSIGGPQKFDNSFYFSLPKILKGPEDCGRTSY